MGYDTRDIAKLYGPSLLDRLNRQKPRAFSYGDIFGLFSDEVRWQTVDTSRPMPELPAPQPAHHAALH